MKKLKFKLHYTASPWNSGTRKQDYTTMRLRVECDKAVWVDRSGETDANVSNKIFVYLKHEGQYCFDHICSAVDLIELPETEGGRWLRQNYIDVLVPSVEILDESWSKIQSDIGFLAREVTSYTDIVTPGEEVEIPVYD